MVVAITITTRHSLGNILVYILIHLVKIKNQIQFTHISKECIEHFDKEMYGFQIRQFVIVCIDTHTKEQTSVPTIYYFVVTELETKKTTGVIDFIHRNTHTQRISLTVVA